MLETGLDRFIKTEYKRFRSLRLGVLCNQASVAKSLIHISDLVTSTKLGLNIVCFFGPQHGIRGEKQDNMIETEDFIDTRYQIPVYSLYSHTRIPTDTMVASIDAFLIDLQDIGTRIYTFVYTMANCMRVAKKKGLKVIVLDRPNPINGVSVEGNQLEENFTSFVGQFPIPVRHGMTMGELAVLFNEEFGIGCELEIIPLKGWKRVWDAQKWGRCWVPPSPNIPSLEAAYLFPGMVHFEGTQVSEGRGTTKPFEWIGAPFIDPDWLSAHLNQKKLPGVYFRPIYFQPTFHKYKEMICGGIQPHILDVTKLRSFQIGVEVLVAIATKYPKEFRWKDPPYEYEHTRMPIDLIAGTDQLRNLIDSRDDASRFMKKVAAAVRQFKKIRNRYLLY